MLQLSFIPGTGLFIFRILVAFFGAIVLSIVSMILHSLIA